MAKVISFVCDFCGETLTGDNRRVEVHKPYISIRGTISLQNQNLGVDEGDYIFLSKKEEIDYRFCDDKERNCFMEWVNMHRDRFINSRKARLRDEADFEARNPYKRTP